MAYKQDYDYNHRLKSDYHFDENVRRIDVPTNAGWTASTSGDGSTVQDLTEIKILTGATANSAGKLVGNIVGLNPAGFNWSLIDWSKRLVIEFDFMKGASVDTSLCQVALSTDIGMTLTEKGVGIYTLDMALYGEVYSSSLHTQDLGVSMSSIYDKKIKIVVDASAGTTSFYANGALLYAMPYFPSGSSSGTPKFSAYVWNGATGGNTYISVGNIKIWQDS